MGVTITVCAEKDCGRMLNGELCRFVGRKPYCNEHGAAASERAEERRLGLDSEEQFVFEAD